MKVKLIGNIEKAFNNVMPSFKNEWNVIGNKEENGIKFSIY